jgi:hypothetical protein
MLQPQMHNHLVHIDAIKGKRLALALNPPVIALSGNVLQRSVELTRWLRRQHLNAVLIVGDLAWGTGHRAVVVAAEVMDWPLVGGVFTLFWPFDDGVYTATISDAEGQVSVLDGSEQVLPIEQAIEFAAHNVDILVVAGGSATEQFRQAGYAVSGEQSLSGSYLVSKRPLSAYTRKGMPHFLHGVMLVLVLAAAWGSYEFEQEMQRREALSREVVLVPPRGSPKLREELRVLVRCRQRIEVLQIYGLDKMLFNSKVAQVTLTGVFTASHAARLRQIADALQAGLTMRGTNWRMIFDAEIPPVKARDLHTLEGYLVSVLSALTAKPGWRATIESYVDGGAPMSLQGGLRVVSRDYTEAHVAAVVEVDPRPLASLLGVVERIPGGVNGKLGDVLFEFNHGRMVKANLSFVVRGKKVAA